MSIIFLRVILKCICYYLIILPTNIFLNYFNYFISLNLDNIKRRRDSLNNCKSFDNDILIKINQISQFEPILN